MPGRFKLEWEITNEDSGKLIRQFLRENHISKTALTDIKFKGGNIRVNSDDVTVRYILNQGDHLEVVFPKEERSEGMQGEKIPLTIIYEDLYVLIVLKPAGMSTIPSREHPSGSLANALIGYYQEKDIEATAHIVTRLDRDTSGIVLIAKHRHVHHLLSQQQRSGQVNRVYQALCEGHIPEDSGKILEPIARKADSIIEREVNAAGQYACTHFKVLARFERFTHIELKLETGRTHQIRVHLSYLGHPLLGDDLYGGSRQYIRRQSLHCSNLAFWHPILEQELNFHAALPEDMQQVINMFG
ncbi:RluA family pseudouridine synthase [Bacillus canaveralius]|uniref:RluA family pseudouridine synthase n=1 Tax=Bacillus canaveralius TaxID=1403243 RepID=UPI000F7A8464|nr:RluA family pseudouridine synthase [Bacillus canaveralius]RSK48673.1 RluA family pseudouridine synthase [Bacillus canaveralius]